MGVRFVRVDYDTELFLPPDMRQRVRNAPNDKKELAANMAAKTRPWEAWLRSSWKVSF